MNLTYAERQELNALSKEAFGVSSRWQKLVNKGVHEPHERDREVLIPTRKGIEKKVVTDRKNIHKSYTVEEVKALMLKILANRKEEAANTEAVAAADSVAKGIVSNLSPEFLEGMKIVTSNNEVLTVRKV